MAFKKATKKQAKLRLALSGPAGSGKTYTALAVATGLGERVAVIDTEHGSASKYSREFNFDTDEMSSYEPQEYVKRIQEAEREGYDVLVIDSLSHAWFAKGGALEQVDRVADRSRSKNKFNAWRDVTPIQNQLVEAIISCKCHVIATMRTKMSYEVTENEFGKKAPTKLGLAPIQRDGMEYEFDVWGELDQENKMVISKTRCSALSGKVIPKPGAEFSVVLKEWLNDGSPVSDDPKPQASHGSGIPPVEHVASEIIDLFAQAKTEADIKAATEKATANKDAINGYRPMIVQAMTAAMKRVAETPVAQGEFDDNDKGAQDPGAAAE